MTDRLIDLDRVRAARQRLAALAIEHPELTSPEAQERLAAADLSTLLDDEEPAMLNDEVVNLRVPSGTKDRAEALCEAIEASQAFRTATDSAAAIGARPPRATTSLALRIALLRGLEAMEQEGVDR